MYNNNFLQDTLTQNVTTGEFHSHGKKDTISKALSNEEHQGRVQGLGKGYTWRNYWGTSTMRGIISISAFEQYKQQMNESMQMLHDRLSRFEQTHSEIASCDAPVPPAPLASKDEYVESMVNPPSTKWSEEVI